MNFFTHPLTQVVLTQLFRLRIARMKMVQKIETGGTRSTSTPKFRFFANALLFVSDARHITH